jgi:hypothetical protein
MENDIITFKFGGLRSVVISPNATESMELVADFMYIKDIEKVKSVFLNTKFNIIGIADQAIPIVKSVENKELFAIDYINDYIIIKVANTLDSLLRFLDRIQKIWKSSNSIINLNLSEENNILAISAFNDFKSENPGCDFSFWEIECLPGLNLGFEQIK